MTADALALLESDQAHIGKLIDAYRACESRNARADERKKAADAIALAFTIHARLEQELLYPAMRELLEGADTIDRCEASQDALRECASQVLATRAEDPLLTTRTSALAERIARHFRMERQQLFARTRSTRTDFAALGRAIGVRRAELHAVAEALREDALVASLTA